MRDKVKKFLEMIAEDVDVMVAAKDTGVADMNTYDVLAEISSMYGGKQYKNILEKVLVKNITEGN